MPVACSDKQAGTAVAPDTPSPDTPARGHTIIEDVGMLTERESEVASLVAKGLRNKAIAHYLGIGEGTVKIHLHNVYRKLRIKSRFQLVMHAHKQYA